LTLDTFVAHITLDYTPAIHQSAGIGRLTRELIHALLALNAPHQFKLFVMGRANGEVRMSNSTPDIRHSLLLSDRWFHRLWFKANLPLPVQWFAGPCDLYHATDFVLPPTLPNTKTVLTVHDLSFERDPGSAVPTLLAFLRKVVPASARRASHIVADSHATAHDLTELYGIAPEKITVIHSGVSERFQVSDIRHQIEEAARIRAKYAIGDAPFVLTVGTMQPRKNHLGLVRAFANLQSPISNLVISGGKGWLYDEVMHEVQRLGLSERVKFIGYADDDDLPALYRAASVFAFPSFYEGFGLPPLEAMACGVPVVTSNTSSLPEVVGDVGLTVNPHDLDALASALNTAMTDEAWRAQAIVRGIERAKTFTWQRAAEQLLGVYERVLINPQSQSLM
jgi:glycosyltransferase involved in cell wall biosynthesis